jgi:hypothetical protein
MNPLLILSIIERAAAIASQAHANLAALRGHGEQAGLKAEDVQAAIARGNASADALISTADQILTRLGPGASA